MTLSRRDFLQRSLTVGTGLGLSYLLDPFASAQVLQAWADATPRKLALLVGINQYQRSAPNLKGCVTDVELYQELLIHRFGFKSQDIVTLTDELATRSNIEAAFLTHLVAQSRPGDVVVFQLSGYGCLTTLQNTGEKAVRQEQLAILPSDVFLPTYDGAEVSQFNGIYEDTLTLLLRSLATDRVTTILDIGVVPSLSLPTESLRERAIPRQEITQMAAAEFNLQERLLNQTSFSREQLQVQRQSNQTPGLLLMAAGNSPVALEIDRPDFSVGLFSYHLTRQLWQSLPAKTLTVQMGNISTRTEQMIGTGQQPEVRGQNRYGTLAWDGVGFTSGETTDAVITTIDRKGETAKVWIGGIASPLLEWLQPQSCFWAFPKTALESKPLPPLAQDPSASSDGVAGDKVGRMSCFATTTALVQLRSRQRWEAVVQRMNGVPLAEGMWLQEAIRVLPRNIPLRLGLSTILNRVERVDAVSFLSVEAPHINVVAANQVADYLLTNLQEEKTDSAKRASSPEECTRYGLAYLGGTVLPNTLGETGEVAKLATQRLLPTLETLRALQWLKLLSNRSTSSLKVTLGLEQGGEPPQLLLRRSTGGTCENIVPATEPEQSIPKNEKSPQILTIERGTNLQYRIQNWNPFPLYLLLFSLESDTSFYMSYATEPQPEATRQIVFKPLVIQPGAAILMPEVGHAWSTGRSLGLTQTFLFFTAQPLTKTLSKVRFRSSPVATAGAIAPLQNPFPIVQQLVSELHQLSMPYTEAIGLGKSKQWVLDLRVWAMMSLGYRII